MLTPTDIQNHQTITTLLKTDWRTSCILSGLPPATFAAKIAGYMLRCDMLKTLDTGTWHNLKKISIYLRGKIIPHSSGKCVQYRTRSIRQLEEREKSNHTDAQNSDLIWTLTPFSHWVFKICFPWDAVSMQCWSKSLPHTTLNWEYLYYKGICLNKAILLKTKHNTEVFCKIHSHNLPYSIDLESKHDRNFRGNL